MYLISYDHLFLLMIMMGFCLKITMADCPHLCECKWKNGKESVICLNANLSIVPTHLDAGTQVLDLTGNNLSIIKDDEFSKAGLLNLQKVYISKCRLKNLERFAFRNLINLVELDLSYNILTNVPSHTFDSIPELRELKLNGNPIQRIINDAFNNVAQLIRLELSDCRIGTIEFRAFHGLEKSLEWLKLDKNRLVEVKPSSFTILQNLHGLELAGNPWNCSCIIRPLREWMLRQNVPFGIPPICHYPKRLYLKPWDKLDLDEFACIPEIFAYDNKTNGIEGRNITMTCRIKGIPEPSVRWLLKNKVIANLSYNSNGKKLYMVHLENNSSDLTIFSADLQDAGIYVCAAENKAGRVEATVTLAVTKKTPEINFTSKILIASVITGIVLVLTSCLIALCLYSVRKKQMIRWRNNRECRRHDDNNYEKIEMNHKIPTTNGNSANNVLQAEIAVVATTARKNGDYRHVPDQEEMDEEEESNASGSNKKNWNTNENNMMIEKRWNSPEHLLDPEDLHIPRRTLQETRDDIRRNINSMYGTSRATPASSSSLNYYMSSCNSDGTYTTTYNPELSSLVEDNRRYPDLIENSSTLYNNKFSNSVIGKANSEGGSVTDIAELFCTLPLKRALIQSSRYRSSDSQSPLLTTTDSRYASSTESYEQESNLRRLSDTQKYHKNNSFLNLTTHNEPSSSPLLLDVNHLENANNSYDYHAAQLERFLEEYRSLQQQLTKMKECCDNLCHQNYSATESSNSTNTCSVSPNSNPSLIQNSIDFRNFENELTKYLLTKNDPTGSDGVFNN